MVQRDRRKSDCAPLQKVNVVSTVEFLQLLARGRPRYVDVHCFMHAIRHDNLVGQGQSPWLHRVLLSKMHLLHFGIGMIGNGVSLWPFDSIIPDLSSNLFINGERGCGSRLWVFVVLNYGCLRHIALSSRLFLFSNG